MAKNEDTGMTDYERLLLSDEETLRQLDKAVLSIQEGNVVSKKRRT